MRHDSTIVWGNGLSLLRYVYTDTYVRVWCPACYVHMTYVLPPLDHTGKTIIGDVTLPHKIGCKVARRLAEAERRAAEYDARVEAASWN